MDAGDLPLCKRKEEKVFAQNAIRMLLSLHEDPSNARWGARRMREFEQKCREQNVLDRFCHLQCQKLEEKRRLVDSSAHGAGTGFSSAEGRADRRPCLARASGASAPVGKAVPKLSLARLMLAAGRPSPPRMLTRSPPPAPPPGYSREGNDDQPVERRMRALPDRLPLDNPMPPPEPPPTRLTCSSKAPQPGSVYMNARARALKDGLLGAKKHRNAPERSTRWLSHEDQRLAPVDLVTGAKMIAGPVTEAHVSRQGDGCAADAVVYNAAQTLSGYANKQRDVSLGRSRGSVGRHHSTSQSGAGSAPVGQSHSVTRVCSRQQSDGWVEERQHRSEAERWLGYRRESSHDQMSEASCGSAWRASENAPSSTRTSSTRGRASWTKDQHWEESVGSSYKCEQEKVEDEDWWSKDRGQRWESSSQWLKPEPVDSCPWTPAAGYARECSRRRKTNAASADSACHAVQCAQIPPSLPSFGSQGTRPDAGQALGSLHIDLNVASNGLHWGRQQRASYVDPNGTQRSFLLHLPEDFAARSQWPLLVYLHGGLGLNLFERNGRPSLKTQGLEACGKSFVVVSPQNHTKGLMDEPEPWVLQLIHSVRTARWVDSQRIYMTGISQGAMTVLELLSVDTLTFAAAACVAGYPRKRCKHLIDGLCSTPTLIVHSRKDRECSYALMEEVGAEVRNAGGPGGWLEVQGDHGLSFRTAYCDSDHVFQWMLSHRRT